MSLFRTMLLAGAVGLALAPAAPVGHAQTGGGGSALTFEAVGDRPLSASDIAFDGAGNLWALSGDVWRLAPGASVWEEVSLVLGSYILPLGPDTLFASFNAVRRSLNGGQTWGMVYGEGKAIFEAPVSGTLLVGTGVGSGVSYSHDRGATWHAGTLSAGTWVPRAEAFAELPPEHPRARRLIAGCWAGLSYSDDGGQTWEKSSLWEDGGRYHVYSVAVGVDGRVYAGFFEVGVTGLQIAVSDDGGQTYTVAHQFGVLTGVGVRLFALPGGPNPEVGTLLAVQYDGTVQQSDDAAASWQEVGQVPFGGETGHLTDAALYDDGRLYVAGSRSGTEREWVYRTIDSVVTTATDAPPEEETGVRLEVSPNPLRNEALVSLSLAEPTEAAVALYDVRGRQVTVLSEGLLSAGRHAFRIDGAQLAEGTYVVRATAGGVVTARTVTLLR